MAGHTRCRLLQSQRLAISSPLPLGGMSGLLRDRSLPSGRGRWLQRKARSLDPGKYGVKGFKFNLLTGTVQLGESRAGDKIWSGSHRAIFFSWLASATAWYAARQHGRCRSGIHNVVHRQNCAFYRRV